MGDAGGLRRRRRLAARGARSIFSLPADLLLVAIAVATGLATLFGGAIALRFRQQMRLILGFSAGAVIGVALFDLMPEALELAGKVKPPVEVLGVMGGGFCAYMILERTLRVAASTQRGHLGPASLTLHSLFDGLGIGLAFQVSPAIGAVVAVAVLAHDVADGVNTVTLSLAGGGGSGRARGWLIADAVAPLVGVGLTRLVVVPTTPLGLAIAAFAGFFLYIGAAALTPHDERPSRTGALSAAQSGISTAAGMAFIWIVVRFAPS